MSSVPRTRMYCSVYGCLENSYKNPEISFFNIPKEPEKRAQWLCLISREDLIQKNTTYRVCEKHFNEEDIVKSEKAVRKRLKKYTLPHLNLPSRPTGNKLTQTDPMVDTTASQTDQVMSENYTSIQTADPLSTKPRKRKLGTEQIEKESPQDTFDKLCDRFLSKDFAELVKAQTYLKSNSKENRHSLEYKMFCLNLFYASPQAYQLLEKTICLPSKTTLSKLYIPMSTQVNDNLFEALKIKANKMSDTEKHCTLVVGAMSLKPNLFYDIKNDKIIGFHEVDGIQSPSPAKYALVVIVQGILVKWSQAIGFALIPECKHDDNISKWTDKLVLKLFDIGLKIRAFVSDLGPELLNAAKKKGISVDKTHFTVNGHKIYYIFDAPHLIKLVRNDLLTYDFHFGNGAVAKFEHILKFYDYDKKKAFKLAYKLTDNHINPSNLEKTKLRYATQLLSRSVATGLSTCIDIKVVDESAKHTVELIKLMNDLFDTLNSSVFRHSYTYKRAFNGNENQIDFLNNMLLFFQTLKLINSKTEHDDTKGVKFIQGFQITIKSILHLHEDLQQEGFQYLLTRRLNQDIIENFFGKIRSNNGKATEPTSRQFISAFRKFIFSNLNQPSKGSNCTEVEDLSEFLVHLKDFESSFNDCSHFVNYSSIDKQGDNLREIMRIDYTEFDIPEKNAFFYVCASLLRKVIDQHKDCDLFNSYLDAHDPACNSVVSRYLSYRNSGTDRNVLVVPPDDFVKHIGKLEQVFRDTFEKQYLNCKIGLSIYEEITKIEFTLPCPCFPKEYLLKLYTRMRIYYTLKNNNKAFCTSRNMRKYFRVANL